MQALADIEIVALSESILGRAPAHFEFLGAGMFSRAYKLSFSNDTLVLRIGSNYMPFLKDEWASNLFPGSASEVPEVIAKGPIGEYFFCFSTYKEGERFDKLNPSAIEDLLPALFEMHQKIAVELPAATRFGFLDPSGYAIYKSWKEALTNFEDWPELILSRKGERFMNWDRLFAETVMNKDFAMACMDKVRRLADQCPEITCLIHGDFGFDNLLVNGEKITAVLDWAESRCGDPLYDIASMQCHGRGINYRKAYKDWLINKNRLPANFEERMDCYMIHIMFCSCWLDAQRGFEDYFEEGKKVLEGLLS